MLSEILPCLAAKKHAGLRLSCTKPPQGAGYGNCFPRPGWQAFDLLVRRELAPLFGVKRSRMTDWLVVTVVSVACDATFGA
jgi:hypothetical protein